MRIHVTTSILTEDLHQPSGARRFRAQVPEMAKRLELGEELRLQGSPKSGHLYQGHRPDLSYITHPCSNKRRNLRTLSEHLYPPVRSPLRRINILSITIAPLEAAGQDRNKPRDLGLPQVAQFTGDDRRVHSWPLSRGRRA